MNAAAPANAPQQRRLAWLRDPRRVVPLILLLGTTLAITSVLGDSVTYDETSHLTAGMSYLVTGDFRLAPDHPPLPKVWAALPLWLGGVEWVSPQAPGWSIGDVFLVGREWLFRAHEPGGLILAGRGMMAVLLIGLWLAVYAVARRLWGADAGLFAMFLAALSPTLLAHGTLVTTDLPITLALLVTLGTFARLLERVTMWRFVAAAAALATAAVTKLSWPLVLPALAVMLLLRLLPARFSRVTSGNAAAPSAPTPEPERGTKPHLAPAPRLSATRVVIVVSLLGLTTWTGIWTTYGWRISMFPEEGATADPTIPAAAETTARHWQRALTSPQGTPRSGPVAGFVRTAADWHLLPDPYLFGLAWTLEATGGRNAYFLGETGVGSWLLYFPLAFLLKTPIPLLVLVLAGIAAVVRGRAECQDRVLLVGLLVFAGVYGLYVMTSGFNVGHRHLLPIYPALLILAGPAARWACSRGGRILLLAMVAWLAVNHVRVFPHYLAFFNELAGGPKHAHRYFADSNLDWGQDLRRLARYAAAQPDQQIKLAYFGSAVPAAYLDCTLLPGSIATGSAAALPGGGTYVISVTHLLGVYDELAQRDFWRNPRNQAYYAAVHEQVAAAERSGVSIDPVARRQFERLRWGWFLHRLRQRAPDERIGWSLWVFRLTAAEVTDLAAPLAPPPAPGA